MLIGNWRNIEELEDCLNLDELKLILEAERAKELRNQKFMAALKGINLDEAKAKSAEEDFMRIKQRVEARIAGISEDEYDINQFGFEVEKEE